jgi:hypothetical protein
VVVILIFIANWAENSEAILLIFILIKEAQYHCNILLNNSESTSLTKKIRASATRALRPLIKYNNFEKSKCQIIIRDGTETI